MEDRFHKELILMSGAHKKYCMNRFSTMGLTSGQPKILWILMEKEGFLQKDLAARCHVEPATMTILLNNMQKKGLIRRKYVVAACGKRAYEIYLTEKGREVAETVIAVINEAEELSFSGFSPAEKQQLLELMSRISSNLLFEARNAGKSEEIETVSDPIKKAIEEETSKVEVNLVPDLYCNALEDPSKAGRIEKISYQTKDYYGDGEKITKEAFVYLPAGYCTEKKYNVLYLMHGIGGDEYEWGMFNDESRVKHIMDNLIARGEIEPFIVVTPNGRAGAEFADVKNSKGYGSFYDFGKELRNELIPYMDANFSTYADREHRAMAGLSMGGMQTINIGICESLDLIGWFGTFSAAPTSYESRRVANAVEKLPEYPVYYMYNICGTEDGIAYGSASNAAKNLPEISRSFVEGKNYTWEELPGGHDFTIWYLGFYNFSKIVFSR